MLAAALITFREGLEAALIVGIMLAVLRQLGRPDWRSAVWWGVAAALAVSAGAGVSLYAIGTRIEGRAEEIFEGAAMLLAAGFLTWMIFWMLDQGRRIHARLTAETEQTVATGERRGLFLLAFLAVAREGLETALFLTALTFAGTGLAALVGGLIGLLAAVVAGWLVFAASSRLDVGRFFRYSSVLLIVVAAGLAAHGVHEFQEAGVLPEIIEHVWDTNAVIDEGSPAGAVLKSLFGYDANPSLLQVATYVAFYAVVGAALLRRRRPSATEA